MKKALNLHAKGKLLLTGEYVVLDGAAALALPTRLGQVLTVSEHPDTGQLVWESLDADGTPWFWVRFDLLNFDFSDTNDIRVATRLQQLLRACRVQRPTFLSILEGYTVRLTAEFPLQWGLGSSSTLVALLAKWAKINPYRLLEASFGGSGYDIACAFAPGPILYQRPSGGSFDENRFTPVHFDPPFAHQLYWVYLGKKQDSREGIRRYRELNPTDNTQLVQQISALTHAALSATDLPTFQAVLHAHENLIAQALQLPRVQDTLFPDFPGTVKSLGAWGGDFVLLASDLPEQALRDKVAAYGFDVCLGFKSLF